MSLPIYKATLLVIDDTPDNVYVLLNLFSHMGYKVLIAQDGERGIQKTLYANPDLILLDIMMPGMNGFEVCQALKANKETKDIPIIFMTALSDLVDKVKGFEVGAADYITKPFQQEEVLARINAHLHIRFLQQQLKQQNKELYAEIEVRKKLEDSLKKTADSLTERTLALERSNMELDAFAHTVAHDLKNPLNAMIILSEVLAESCDINKLPDAKSVDRLLMINRAGKEMLNIVNALLLLAGVSKQVSVDHHPLDMAQIVGHVIRQRLSNMLTEYQAEIQLPEQWHVATGYTPWIEEIWMNYLTNGLKYGGRPPSLTLGSDQQADQIRFWIRDNGQGLKQETQQHLFKQFTRLHKDWAEGHGLGLSIVRQIVEKLGGYCGVESELGKGSLFYFTLPKSMD